MEYSKRKRTVRLIVSLIGLSLITVFLYPLFVCSVIGTGDLTQYTAIQYANGQNAYVAGQTFYDLAVSGVKTMSVDDYRAKLKSLDAELKALAPSGKAGVTTSLSTPAVVNSMQNKLTSHGFSPSQVLSVSPLYIDTVGLSNTDADLSAFKKTYTLGDTIPVIVGGDSSSMQGVGEHETYSAVITYIDPKTQKDVQAELQLNVVGFMKTPTRIRELSSNVSLSFIIFPELCGADGGVLLFSQPETVTVTCPDDEKTKAAAETILARYGGAQSVNPYSKETIDYGTGNVITLQSVPALPAVIVGMLLLDIGLVLLILRGVNRGLGKLWQRFAALAAFSLWVAFLNCWGLCATSDTSFNIIKLFLCPFSLPGQLYENFYFLSVYMSYHTYNHIILANVAFVFLGGAIGLAAGEWRKKYKEKAAVRDAAEEEPDEEETTV